VDIRKADQEMARCKMAVTRLGAGQGFQVILHDITSYLEALERGKRAQRLGMTGRIARGLAHEIRNPLSNISMATHQLAQEGLAPRSDSIYLDIINRNNLRIAQLIDAILDSSKDTSFSPVRVEIHSLIEEALLLCKDRITLQEVEVVEDYADHAPILRLDPDRIRLALVNLMLNAIEAMRKVETPRLVIRTRAHPTEFMIQVEDNGEGIPPELQEKIFEPFFTSKKTGIGLGMLSLQNAIQMHGGRLQLKSTVGEGTSFSLFFPVPPPSKPES
jgi:two-component system, sporulation sensor kinase E